MTSTANVRSAPGMVSCLHLDWPLPMVQYAVRQAMVVDRASAFGLSLNPEMPCVAASAQPGRPLHLQGFPLGPGSTHEHCAGLTILGPALTVSEEYAPSVEQSLVTPLTASLQHLSTLRHPQAGLLLKACKVVSPLLVARWPQKLWRILPPLVCSELGSLEHRDCMGHSAYKR